MDHVSSERYDAEAWANWVVQLDPAASWEQRAEVAKVARATIYRWVKGTGQPTPNAIVEIARHYGASALRGLVAAGWVLASDVERMSVEEALCRAEDRELTDQILHRLSKVSEAHPLLTESLSWDSSVG